MALVALQSGFALAGCARGEESVAEDDAAISAAAPGLGTHYAGLLRSSVGVRFADGKQDTLVTTVRAFATFDTSGGDDRVKLVLKACSFTLPQIDGFSVAVEDAVLQRAIPEVTMAARIAKTGDRTTFTTQPTVLLLGLSGISASESLPADKKDARVVDQDGDDEPGFSLKGTKHGVTARIYSGVRAVAEGGGDIAADGSIVARGALRYDFKKDVVFYGDSVPIVDAAGVARDKIAEMTPIGGTEKQEFRLVKLEGAADAFATTAAKCAAVAKSL